MRRARHELQAWNAREQAGDAIVDGHVRGEPGMAMQQHAPLHLGPQQRRQPLGAVSQKLRDMRDLERGGVARRHDVGHVHVTRRTPRHDLAAPVLVGGIVEARHRAGGHVARPERLMVMRGAAAIGRPARRGHVVAHALQQHDRQADHLGVAQHVAAEPKGDALGAYIHFSSSSSLSCSRAKVLMRGNTVGSCLAGS